LLRTKSRGQSAFLLSTEGADDGLSNEKALWRVTSNCLDRALRELELQAGRWGGRAFGNSSANLEFGHRR
jgi:hypothetical protein